jgi:hypothetical protein
MEKSLVETDTEVAEIMVYIYPVLYLQTASNVS